jgi:hypothetical protein
LNQRYGVIGQANGPAGIGVDGSGTRDGVVSNGPFSATGAATFNSNVTVKGNASVAAGRAFTCAKCVTNADLADGSVNAAKLDPSLRPGAVLASGQSESGAWGGVAYSASGNGQFDASINFVRPISGSITVVDVGPTPGGHCPGAGQADAGYLCLYSNDNYQNVSSINPFVETLSGLDIGANAYYSAGAPGFIDAGGSYTVTAP